MRHLVLVAAMLCLFAFVGLFGYGMLFHAPGSPEVMKYVIESFVAAGAGISLYYWWQRLDRIASLRRYQNGY